MKSKKLISFLCAAAMTASTFVGMVSTASAAATPVWSFDGSSTDGWTGTVVPEVKTDEGSDDQYLDFLAGERTEASDTGFVLPVAAQLEDDYVLEYDTFIHASNGMGRLNQYTQLAFTGEDPGQDPQFYNDPDYLAAAEEVDTDLYDKRGWNDQSGQGNGYASDIVSSLTSRIELLGKMLINYDGTNAPSMDDGDAQIGDSRWVRVRVEVKSGKAKTTIADSNGIIVNGEEFKTDASGLSQIKLTFGRADTQLFIPTTPGNIKLDNIKVYDGIAGTPAFSTDGLRKSAIVATPIPAPEKVAGPAPKFYAPDSADTPYTANFNGETTGELAHIDVAAQDPVKVTNGMTVQIGNRPDGADAKTYASIVKVADGDNAVRLSADQFSTNGRGPVLKLDDDIDLSQLTSGSAVMSFAVYLSKTSANGLERIFLVDNMENVDGNGCARDIVAVITTEDIKVTDEDGNESYRYTAGESNIGLHVEPEAWHTITVVATAGDSPVRLFVDGKYKAENEEGKNALSPALKLDMVGTGEGNKHAVTHLPMIAIENTKAAKQNEETGLFEGGTVYSTALIDNVLTYYVQGDLEPKNLPQTDGVEITPTPAPTKTPVKNAAIEWKNEDKKAEITSSEEEAFDAVLIHAAYDTEGTLVSLKSYPVEGISAAAAKIVDLADDTVHIGDKLMVWNNMKDMLPYAVATVEEGEVAKTPEPKPTPEVTDTPATDTPATDTPATDTPATDTPATDTPTVAPATPTPEPTPQPTLPDLTGKTVIAENDFSTDDVWGFSTGRNGAAPAVEDGKLVLTKGNNANAGTMLSDVKVFDAGVTSSADTELMFDYNPQIEAGKNRWSSLSITNSNDKVLFSFASMGNGGVAYLVGARATFADNALVAPATKIAANGTSANVFRVYLHVANGKVSGLIFDVAGETPVFVAEIPETAIEDANVGKIVAQEGYSLAPQAIDNVKIVTNDANWKPAQAVAVTAPAETDGTLAVDKTSAVPGATVTITATAKPGKKITGVQVMNGATAVDVTPGENGTYTFAMPEADVTVSATYDRADIATIEVSGHDTVSSEETSTYTAVAKAADGTVLEGITFTWTVTGGGDGTSITADGGVLTVAEAEADATELTIKASAEGKDGTYTASVTKATVYNVTAATGLTGGSVEVSAAKAIEGKAITVTLTAATGYQVATVTYTPAEGEAQPVTATEGVYKFNMPAADVTVSATFTKKDYAITNATAADAGGTITVPATAQMDDEVTITVAPDDGKDLQSITVTPTTEGSTTAITVTSNKFTMPAEPVTVTATFTTAVSKYTEFADGKIKAVSVTSKEAGMTYAQLKMNSITGHSTDGTTRTFADGVHITDSKTNSFTVIKVDLTGTDKANKIITLGFDITAGASYNSNIGYDRVTGTVDGDIGDLTFTTASALAVQNIGSKWSDKGKTTPYAIDIQNDFAETDVVYYVIYGVTAREQSLGNFSLTTKDLYTTTVNVKDNAETPAAIEGATVTIKSGDTTVATGSTTAEGVFTAALEAGSYTVDVAMDGYADVAGQALTVAAGGANSVDITLAAQADATFAVTVNTAPFTTVKLNAGTSTKGTEVAEQTVTADATGAATLADVPAGTYTIDVTPANTYLETKTGVSIEAVKDTPVNVPLAYTDTNMVYGESFGGYTGVGIWNTAHGEARTAFIGDASGDKYLQGNCTNKQTGHLIHDLGEAVSLTGNTVTVEYDFRVADHGTAVMTGVVSLGDSAGNVAFAVGQKSTTWNMAYYTGGAFSNSVASPTWGLDGKAENNSTEVEAGAFNGTGWYHITIVFEAGKATLTVTDKADSTKTKTISDIEVESTDIKNIKLGYGKVFGGANGGGQASSVGELDNVSITSVAAAAE